MINRKIVMIPGPSPVVRSIQNEMGRETVAFGDPAFVADCKELLADLKSMLKCSGEVFVIAGTGTMAMEMAIANTTKRGDNVLIVSHGYFGDRFIEICEHKGLNTDVIASEWGKIVPVEDLRQKLASKNYAAVTVSHVDTATGVAAPIAEIGEMMKEFPDTMYIVDGVCATAGIPESVDDMNIDILFTGSQKAFGVAPGLAMLWASKKAIKRRQSLGTIPEYYVDFHKWLPIMHDPSKYFATPAVNLVWALKESVRIINQEGLENRCARHAKQAAAMRAALTSIGLSVLAEEGHQAATLSNVLYMDGIDDVAFRNLVQEEGIIVAGGLAAYAGKMFRIGHMGNADTHDMVSALAAVERTLLRLGCNIEPGTAVGAFTKEI